MSLFVNLLLSHRAAEDTFLSAIINYTNSSTVHFKLSPTYVLYMACRYVLSPSYRPDMSPSERTHKVIAIVNKMVSMMEGVIQVSNSAFRLFIACTVTDATSLISSIIAVCFHAIRLSTLLHNAFVSYREIALFDLGEVLFTPPPPPEVFPPGMLFRNALSTAAAVAPARASVCCLFTSQCDRLNV